MKNIEVDIYISQMITFFENNPGDFMDLVGTAQKDKFFQMMKDKSLENVEKGEDFILTKQQILDIVLELKAPELTEKLGSIEKIEQHIMKTKFGDIFLN